MATASVVRCGMAPWPPEPLTFISKASEAAIMGPPSGVTLLGGLEDEPHGAAQPFAQVILAEGASGADEHARMPIVAAGVHLPVYLRGERKIRRFMDRQSVHVGPQGNCRPVASSTPQGGDDTVLGDAGLYLQRQAVQSVEYLLGGLLGVEAELRLSVYVAPEGDDILPEAFPDLLFEALEPLGYFHGASFPRHNCLPLPHPYSSEYCPRPRAPRSRLLGASLTLPAPGP